MLRCWTRSPRAGSLRACAPFRTSRCDTSAAERLSRNCSSAARHASPTVAAASACISAAPRPLHPATASSSFRSDAKSATNARTPAALLPPSRPSCTTSTHSSSSCSDVHEVTATCPARPGSARRSAAAFSAATFSAAAFCAAAFSLAAFSAAVFSAASFSAAAFCLASLSGAVSLNSATTAAVPCATAISSGVFPSAVRIS
mmetsp:Transcript_66987/g.160161  ORF Transcript_66987/g.160161 Transcript_66987/m.160161 type:complete len:202 (-) Transcript_66987:36-641(-)